MAFFVKLEAIYFAIALKRSAGVDRDIGCQRSPVCGAVARWMNTPLDAVCGLAKLDRLPDARHLRLVLSRTHRLRSLLLSGGELALF
jgi:hypothetical protein